MNLNGTLVQCLLARPGRSLPATRCPLILLAYGEQAILQATGQGTSGTFETVVSFSVISFQDIRMLQMPIISRLATCVFTKTHLAAVQTAVPAEVKAQSVLNTPRAPISHVSWPLRVRGERGTENGLRGTTNTFGRRYQDPCRFLSPSVPPQIKGQSCLGVTEGADGVDRWEEEASVALNYTNKH